MEREGDRRMYRRSGGAIVRASPHAGLEVPGWPDLTGTTPAHVDSWQQWLRHVRALPSIMDAIAHASPVLAERMEKLCAAGAPPESKRARRIVASVIRYLLRMQYRATPFGLFAGVAPAEFGVRCSVRFGEQHRAVATPDAGWLTELTTRLESLPELRERLMVVANTAAVVRGDRLILPHQSRSDGGAPAEVSLTFTDPLRTTVDAARTSTPYAKVAASLAAGFPDVSHEVIEGMLDELVQREVLLTNLRATSTATDPLDHLVEQLDEAGAADVPETAETMQALHGIRAAVRSCNHERAGLADREAATSEMTRLAPTSRPLAMDLRLDHDLVLPEPVGRQAEEAAALLARLSPHPSGPPVWREWRDRFLDRYDTDQLVDVLDSISGLGYPAGYPGSTAPEPSYSRRARERDERLLAVAQAAAMDGRREVVMDQRLLDTLAAPESSLSVPAHTELNLRVESASQAALNSGRFRIVVLGASRGVGAITGRFTGLLDHREEVAAALTQPRSKGSALPVQLSFPPLHPSSGHVTRTERLLEHALAVGEHHPEESDVFGPKDLAVGCDGNELYLVSHSLGCRVEPVVLHALNLRGHTPPLVRFLAELPRAQHTVLSGFDWGAATHLPFLPRLRVGRIVLCPARWRVNADELSPRSAPWPDWVRAWRDWGARRGVPDEVELGGGDQRLRLDLNEEAHLVLLRSDLDNTGHAVLTEAPMSGAFGWCDDRSQEIVVPLTAVGEGDRS